MRPVPWWTVLSATAAPVFLIGGWSVASARQAAEFDSVRETISALAAHGATDRWIMTGGLAALGCCHIVTALGLRPAALPGRILLAAGGFANIAVTALPQPADGSSTAHVWAATVGFGTLAVWPALGWRHRPTAPGLRAGVAVGASAALLASLSWFAVELYGEGDRIGLTERVVAGAEAGWPLVVVLTARRWARLRRD